MQISFRSKLILSYIIVVMVSFGSIAFFLDKRLEERYLGSLESSLITQAMLIEELISPAELSQADAAPLQRLATKLGHKIKCRITIIDAKGKVLADSQESAEDVPRMTSHIDRPEVARALSGDMGVNIRYSPTLRIDMLYVALPLKDTNRAAGALRLALPLDSVNKMLGTIRGIVMAGCAFAVVLAVILGSLVASHTIKPIKRMIHVSRKFAEGDFARRIIQAPPDEMGELAGTLNKMAQDIEDKIREVRLQNQHLEAIFNSMIEGVIVVDRSHRIVSVNSTIEKIFDIKKKDAEGRLLLEEVRNTDIAGAISEALKKGECVSREISLVYPVRRTFQINATPVFDAGDVSGCLAVVHDITDLKRLQTVRSDFVANVSHELKTPLTSIKGFIETLLEGALDDKDNSRTFLTIIKDHADRLDSLVRDLLELAHLESKEISIARVGFDVSEQVNEIVMGFGSQLKKKGIEVVNDIPRGMSLNADKGRIGQVITNLIDNAIKFNKDSGHIKIYSEVSGGTAKITVEDSGSGIPVKDMPRIFERFYRVDKARSRELGGTGLGLSIVKHIVELHGGAVGVHSVEGRGSKFWFTIPC